mmetsp:Transcript_27391/g.68369  ORF Transcript_27391/g.68369 Transcript_27391/m.68369 type:complete len:201 (-) Transcript_27391:125-727(-)
MVVFGGGDGQCRCDVSREGVPHDVEAHPPLVDGGRLAFVPLPQSQCARLELESVELDVVAHGDEEDLVVTHPVPRLLVVRNQLLNGGAVSWRVVDMHRPLPRLLQHDPPPPTHLVQIVALGRVAVTHTTDAIAETHRAPPVLVESAAPVESGALQRWPRHDSRKGTRDCCCLGRAAWWSAGRRDASVPQPMRCCLHWLIG